MPENMVIFGIPLIARKRAPDWGNTLDNLQATLQSILNQTDNNFRVIVAADDEIELPEIRSSRVRAIQVRDDVTQDFSIYDHSFSNKDAGRKRYIIEAEAKRLGAKYLMHADADDLIDERLVEMVRSQNHPIGYAIRSGFVLDLESGRVLPCPSPLVGVSSFDGFCGTSIILNLTAPDGVELPWPSTIANGGHHKVRQRALDLGYPLFDISEPMVVYVLNTGQNMSMIRSDAEPKRFLQRLVKSIQTSGQPLTRSQMRRFGLYFDNSPWID